MLTFHIKTYGCQMNERESEALSCLLSSLGYLETDDEATADVVILNTCSVREQAERKAIGKAGLLQRNLPANPTQVVGIIGCMAQNRGEELFRKIRNLNFIAGTEQLHRVPELIQDARNGIRRAELSQNTGVCVECPGHIPGKVCAMTSIMQGCNQRCSYCIVPHTRGTERSREPDAVVREVQTLVDQGTKEILLLGQNITAYGLVEARRSPDYDPKQSPFADLLEKLNDIKGLERIRFTSPHVTFMNDRFIDAICSLPKVCKAFHIPLQSGSDRILKLMHRPYTAQRFLEKVEAIRQRCPKVAFSTDVIVGFCSETEEEFNATRTLMQTVGFDMAYIFRYSPRKGTLSADTMPDDVPDAVKRERNQLLLQDLTEFAEKRNKEFLGTKQEVLVEGPSARNPARWTGRTPLNKTVNFPWQEGLTPGEIRTIAITATSANALTGKLA